MTTTFNTADELVAAVRAAEDREMRDDHLTTEERQNIVNGFRVFFPQEGVERFSDLDEAFVFCVFDAAI